MLPNYNDLFSVQHLVLDRAGHIGIKEKPPNRSQAKPFLDWAD